MDSLTQFVLGASVGEAVLGKKVGNKAIVWGGIAGTIPDLDVFLNNFYNEIDALLLHRGFSHSIFFPILAAPILGFLISKIHKDVGAKQWSLLFFWSLITHPLLDLFTGYGTGLLVPFYNVRFQLDTIFIIDPLYTLPPLVAVISILFIKRNNVKRALVLKIGLVISHLYLCITIFNKLYVDSIVIENIEEEQIVAKRFMTSPSPFNNILWWALIEKEDEFLVGYISLLDSQNNIEFKSIDKGHNLISGLKPNAQIEVLEKFTKGYFVVKPSGNNLIFNDLRFGTVAGWFDLSKDYIFSFDIQEINGNIYVKRRPAIRDLSKEDFNRLLTRLKGI
ncbi:MAG: metal-dependent hydrolase [Cyclobacteriaceae bacterium]